MVSKSMAMMNRLTALLLKTTSSSTSLIHTRGYSNSNSNLYSKISPLGNPSINLIPELNNWVEAGKKVRVAELQRILRDLRKRRRFSQALQVCEWMDTQGFGAFRPGDHAVTLDLVGRVHGVDAAEKYFNRLGDEFKTVHTYGALLNCYVKACLKDKALAHMERMKEMGFTTSSLAYNDLMCLYTNTGEYEKIPGLLDEMKENGVSPDNFSYRICINSYGARGDIESLEKVLGEMEGQSDITMDWTTYSTVANFYIKAGLTDKAVSIMKKLEEKLGKKEGLGYNHLISHYASLGNKAEVMRVWELKKSTCKKCINMDYITMLGSLVKLEALEEAEQLFEEWESSGNAYDFRVPNVLLIGYSKKGLLDKAESFLERLTGLGKVPLANSWGILAGGYVNKDEMENAMRCMKIAFSVDSSEGVWKPNAKVITSILRWLGDTAEPEEVEVFVRSLKAFKSMDKDMYHALIKANVRAGKDVSRILENMKADNVDENEEIENIISANG